jgi:hypothetical protein
MAAANGFNLYERGIIAVIIKMLINFPHHGAGADNAQS